MAVVKLLTITVRCNGSKHGDGYLAHSCYGDFLGASPDEALGYAVREYWLRNGNGPVDLRLILNTQLPGAHGKRAVAADFTDQVTDATRGPGLDVSF